MMAMDAAQGAGPDQSAPAPAAADHGLSASRREPDEATLNKIRDRAYQIWDSNGRPIGRDAEHWRIAEEEILGRVEIPDQEDMGPAADAGRTANAAGADGAPAGRDESPDGEERRSEAPAGADEGAPAAAERAAEPAAAQGDGAAAAETALAPEVLQPALPAPEEEQKALPPPEAVAQADAEAEPKAEADREPAPVPPVRVLRAGAKRGNGADQPQEVPAPGSPTAVPGTEPRLAVTSRIIVDLSALSRGFGGALAGGVVLASGVPALWLDWVDWSRQTVERNARTLGDLARCRSLKDVIAVENAMLAETLASLFDESVQLFEHSARVTRTALKTMRDFQA